MKAIILAAGYGKRMRPLTDTVHKTLLTVGDKTIIERIIDGLYDNGIVDIVFVTGYMADELREHLESCYPDNRFTFVHNPRYRETNNIFSLALAINSIEIDDDILLIESDLVYEQRVIRRLIDSSFSNAALVDRFGSGMDGTVVTVSDNVITNIIPPHLQDKNFDFSDKFKTLNVYRFSKEFCNTHFKQLLTYYAKVIDDNCYYELILGILIYMQKETIHAEILDGELWSEVDDPNDLRVCQFIFEPEQRGEILESSFGGYWAHNVVDFCFLRNMYFPNNSILSELKGNFDALVQNYGSRQEVLDQKLAYFLLCPRENVTLLNGASQIYPILRSRFGNDRTLIPSPTFGEYSRVFANQLTYPDHAEIDCDQIEAKADDCSVVVFVNPNNPTGTLLSSEWIHEFSARHPDKTVIVDESFIDFSGKVSMLELLEQTPLDNVLVLKSLSKCLGVPGMRIGFLYSHNESANKLVHDALPIWNANSIAEGFLEMILKHRDSLAASFKKTAEDREAFREALSAQDLVRSVHPSGGNFVLAELDDAVSPVDLSRWLLSEKSVLIKDVSDKLANGNKYIRLAVRLPEENQAFTRLLQEYRETTQAVKK